MNKNKKEKLKQACEHSERQAKVKSILDGVLYPTNEDRQVTPDSFVNCKLNIEEIEQVVQSLKPDHSAKVSNKQAGYSASGVF